ncbi:MAG: FecR family protein [Bacteroidota bacterium]|nr:FecR family protein [Bacteroidota bacterium]
MLNTNSINDEIKEIIICFLTDDINGKQLEVLNQWINKSEENKVLFKMYKSTWILSGMMYTKEQFFENKSWDHIQNKLGFESDDLESESASNLRRIGILKKFRTAAIWLLFLGFGSLITYLLLNNKPSQNYNAEITVPYGTKTIAKLPDGSTVYLNAGSKIIYNQDFNKTKRLVYLSGEAYFKVATNKSKPFEVITPYVIVRATGTKFNVKAYPNERYITTTLVEGKIDVRKTDDQDNKSEIELKPKQCLVYYKTEKNIQPVPTSISYTKLPIENENAFLDNYKVLNNVKTELYTSWSEENWVIESESLRTFAPKIERRFDMIIRFEDEEIKNYTFSGTIRKETIEQILQALKLTTPMIDYKIIKDTVILKLDRKIKQKYESK